VPAIRQGEQIAQNRYEQARMLAVWKERVSRSWHTLELYVDGRREGQLSLGEGIDIRTWVRMDGMNQDDIAIELVYGEVKDEQVQAQHTLLMNYTKRELDGSYRYDTNLKPEDSGSIAYNVRVVPTHPLLKNKYELGLIRWG